MDIHLLERVNPVFNTARMTVYHLSLTGDQDAMAMVRALKIGEEAWQIKPSDPGYEVRLKVSEVLQQIRYNATAALAESVGFETLVDLPCGYAPRGLRMAREGKNYIGLDLPATISEVDPAVRSLISPEDRRWVRYVGVDATNGASLQEALEGVAGPICITTDGLLMYFSNAESATVCDNMARLLRRYGGAWVSIDPEQGLQYVLLLRALFGEEDLQAYAATGRHAGALADVEVERNLLSVDPNEPEAGIQRARDFFAAHGLKAERLPVADYLPKLTGLDEAAQAAVRGAMERCCYWKMTLLDSSEPASAPEGEKAPGAPFHMAAELREGRITMGLTGRLDTLTAPQVLSRFEELSASHDIRAVTVDCRDLKYISSAGLRVLLMMHKRAREGVTLKGTAPNVMEILQAAGFDAIMHMDKG